MSVHSSQPVAIISGAFGYVGKAVSKKLAEEGFSLILLYNNKEDVTVQNILMSLPGDTHKTFKCDLTSSKDVIAIFDTIRKSGTQVSLCVHTAGLKPERKKLIQTEEVSFKKQLDVNVIGSFNFLTQSAKILQESQGGVLVGITTIGVVVNEATKSLGGYIPAKYAVQGMLTMLADEVASSNVRVYSVAPGFMEDGMNKDIPKAFVEMIKAKTKHKTLASAEQIAEKVYELSISENNNQKGLVTIPLAPEYEL